MSRLGWIAVLVTGGVMALTGVAAADEPGIVPVVEPRTTAPAAPSAPAASPASPAGSPRPWLAHPPASEPQMRAPTTPWRPFAIVAIVAAIGAAGVFTRKRWMGGAPRPEQPRLRVLDSVRLAEKSHLVVAQVGNRSILLGVTAQSVRRIAWLKAAAAAAPAAEGAPVASEDEPLRAGFASVLRKSFGYGPVTPAPSSDGRPKTAERSPIAQNAASIIAARTRDTVDAFSTAPERTTAQSEAAEAEPTVVSMMEGQVSGLRKRRR